MCKVFDTIFFIEATFPGETICPHLVLFLRSRAHRPKSLWLSVCGSRWVQDKERSLVAAVPLVERVSIRKRRDR